MLDSGLRVVRSSEDRNDHLGVGIAMGETYEIENMNRPC